MNFEISDTSSSRKLRFSHRRPDYFNVEICGDISGSIKVYSYCPHSDTIDSLFNKLGCIQSPWKGELSWASLEGEFSLKFTCSSVGHVSLVVELASFNDEFTIRCGLNVELGQLQDISKNAHIFFSGNA